MLSSIHPLGERSKGNRYGVTATAHIVGAVLGGALLGVVAGLVALRLGHALGPRPREAVLLAVVVVAAALELAGRRPPSWRRQVNEVWLTTYRGWVYGGGFGVQLGAALVTIVTSPLTYVMVAAAALVGSFPAAVVVAATFGLARGATILASARVRDQDALVRLHRRLVQLGPPVARGAAVAMVVCAGRLGGVIAAW